MVFFSKLFSDYHKAGGAKELLIIALPMIISTACDGVMTFTDRLFLARVGTEQMNAAMGGGLTMQMLLFFFLGLTGYTTALVAQYYGAKQKNNTTVATFQGLIISVLAWPIVLLVKPLAIHFFHIMHISASQIGPQTDYLNILVWGSIFSLLRHTLSCYFSGIGKTRIVMWATVAAMVSNILLDYILIFGKFGLAPMGIKGAAFATIAGSSISLAILLLAYLRHQNRLEFGVMQSFRFNWGIMKKLIHFGYPAGLELFLNFFALVTLISLFHSQGDDAATASTIMFNWDLVSFIPLLGIEIAVTSLVGRYMGAGRPQVAHRSALSGIKTGLFYSAIILVLFVFIPETLVRVFHPSEPSPIFEQAVPMAVSMVQIAALYVLVEAIMVALVGALRGAGDTLFTMLASVAAHWMFVPVVYISLKVFHLSVPISWFLMVICFLLFSSVLFFRFRSEKWKTIKVIEL